MDCSHCSSKIISPVGYNDNGILVLGDAPNKYDVRNGLPLSGTTLDILRNELSYVGITLDRCLLANLWQHVKPKKITDEHLSDHLVYTFSLIREAENVLLIGTDITKKLLSTTNTTSLYGLRLHGMVNPKNVMMVTPHPNAVMYGTLGEFRLALKKFEEAINEGN